MGLEDRIFIEQPLRIGFFGEFSAGKSTLLNTILEVDEQATGVNPTTDRVAVFCDPLVAGSHLTGVATVACDCAFAHMGLSFWDTPGLNSEHQDHSDRALDVAGQVNLALLLVPADQGITRSVEELYRALVALRVDSSLANPWIVFTKWDRLDFDDEEEQEETEHERWAAANELSGDAAIFFVDARRLDAFDGPRLLSSLQELGLWWVRNQLVREVANGPIHPLRQVIALNRDWRECVPDAWVTDELQTWADDWEVHCSRQLLRRRHLRRAAVLGTSMEVEQRVSSWRDGLLGRLSDWRLGRLVHRSLERADHRRRAAAPLAKDLTEFKADTSAGGDGSGW